MRLQAVAQPISSRRAQCCRLETFCEQLRVVRTHLLAPRTGFHIAFVRPMAERTLMVGYAVFVTGKVIGRRT